MDDLTFLLETPDFFNTIYAEAGGGPPEEISAAASVFLNRVLKEGLEKALSGSSAYKLKSKEYQKAASGKLNEYEQKIYERNKALVTDLINNPEKIQPFYYMENVKEFGEPKWSKGLKFQDIGRQRFYYPKNSHYKK